MTDARDFNPYRWPEGTPEGKGGEYAPKGVGISPTTSVLPPFIGPPVTRAYLEHQARQNIKEGSDAAREAGVKPLIGVDGHVMQISTRNITGIGPKVTENSNTHFLQPDLATLKKDQKAYDAAADLFRNSDWYPGMRGYEVAGNSDQTIRAVMDRIKGNIMAMHGDVDPAVRARTALWYLGARRVADRLAETYGINDANAAGVIAAMSPTKEWFSNVYLAERTLDILSNQKATKWDGVMTRKANQLFDGPKHQATIKAIKGKTLGELNDPLHKAMWIRTYAEVNPMSYKKMTPEGAFSEVVRNLPQKGKELGRESLVIWQSLENVANAVTAAEAGFDRDALSRAMGDKHKVRSFYNNILDPLAKNRDVTIDTHATAASWMMPLAGSEPAVLHSLHNGVKGVPGAPGSIINGIKGTYPIYAEAYREAARELGIMPRELQSIVWEAQRSLFANRQQKGIRAAVDAIWDDFHAGKISIEEARRRILFRG